jgi:hypothetical protein
MGFSRVFFFLSSYTFFPLALAGLGYLNWIFPKIPMPPHILLLYISSIPGNPEETNNAVSSHVFSMDFLPARNMEDGESGSQNSYSTRREEEERERECGK